MRYLIAAAMAAAAAALAWIGLDVSVANKIKLFAVADADEVYESKNFTKKRIIVAAVCLGAAVFATSLRIMNTVSDVLGVIKMLAALLCMTGAGSFDYREHRIPNIFPLVMAVGAIAILASGVLLGQSGAIGYVTTSVAAALGCGIVLFLAAALTKQGIGAGDIKLISALALMTGVYAVIGTLFFAVVMCSVYAIFALLLKKKTVSSGVPFGPFLLLGYMAMTFLVNY